MYSEGRHRTDDEATSARLAQQNIRVNCLCPGSTAHGATESRLKMLLIPTS